MRILSPIPQVLCSKFFLCDIDISGSRGPHLRRRTLVTRGVTSISSCLGFLSVDPLWVTWFLLPFIVLLLLSIMCMTYIGSNDITLTLSNSLYICPHLILHKLEFQFGVRISFIRALRLTESSNDFQNGLLKLFQVGGYGFSLLLYDA